MSADLSGLTIGSLTLTPAFDADTLAYSADTTNASNKVSVTTKDPDASVQIMNGATEVSNGGNATWAEGTNTLTIMVTNGNVEKTYTVRVTKS